MNWTPRPITNGLYVVRCLAHTDEARTYGYLALWVRLDGHKVSFCHGQSLRRDHWEPLSLARGDSEWCGPLAFEEDE